MQSVGLLERIQALVGTETSTVESLVEAGHVRRFVEAIEDPNPRWEQEAPPTFLVALAADVPQLPEVLEYGSAWLNAGDSFEYERPVRIGDRISSRTRLAEAFEKEGSTGRMLFLAFETEHRNQHGELVAHVRGTRIRR
jgi:hypothetical protein